MFTILFLHITIRMQSVCCAQGCYNSNPNCDHIFFKFLVILSSQYDWVIINFNAMSKSHFIVHKTLSCEQMIADLIVTRMNCVCCTHCTVISALCNFRLCCNLKTNLFICIVLSTALCWIQNKSACDQCVVTNRAHSK